MRKLLAWFLAALMALSGFAFAEATEAPATQPTEAVELPTEPPLEVPTLDAATAGSYNGRDAARAGGAVYMAIPDGARQMLVRVPVEGDALCVDRGDRIEDLMPYAGGVVYLKTENNSSAIMGCSGDQVAPIYAFGASTASGLNFYNGKMLVLIDGILHSIEPGTQLCLRMSGTQMLDYVVDGDVAYFLSAGDRVEYTATLDDGNAVSAQAGCVYSLDLKTGETNLLLKSGVRDLKFADGTLYFHNLADAYAVRTGGSAELMGRVNGLDVQQHELSDGCTEADSGFWALDRGLVVWHSGALNMQTEAGPLALYSPENGATVASDGECLYVWESSKPALTQVQLNGTSAQIYGGDLTQAADLTLLVPNASVDPNATIDPNATVDPNATATPEPVYSDLDPLGNSDWFDNFTANDGGSSSGSSSGSSAGTANRWPGATPIGTTPTPKPTATAAPVNTASTGGSSTGSGASTSGASTGGASTSGSSSSGSSSSGSSGSSSSGGSYSVSIKNLKITGDVNVRSGPSLGYRILTSVPKGKVISCTGKASKDGRGVVWYRVKYNGTTGWVSSAYAKKTSASTSSSSGSSSSSSGSVSSASGTRYATGSVYLRSGPGKSYSVKGSLEKGVKIKISAKSTDSRGVVWYKTKYQGVTGWVSARYLSSKKPSSGGGGGSTSGATVVTTGSVTIRKKANKSSKALGTVPSGKRVTYLGSSKKDSRGVTWYKIKYNGISGWISSKYSHRD